MERHGDEVDVSEEEASAGEKSNVVRYVLAISLALIVVAFAIIVGSGWLSSDTGENDSGYTTQKTG